MPSGLLWKTTLESESSPHSAFQPRRPMSFYPDIITEVRGTKWVHCLSIKGESLFAETKVPNELYQKDFSTEDEFSGENAMIMGLALTKDTTRLNVYQRVGLIRWVKRYLFSGSAASTFTFI